MPYFTLRVEQIICQSSQWLPLCTNSQQVSHGSSASRNISISKSKRERFEKTTRIHREMRKRFIRLESEGNNTLKKQSTARALDYFPIEVYNTVGERWESIRYDLIMPNHSL